MLLPLTRPAGARLLLHGEAALAKLAGVDGVHLPAGADAAAARALLGPEKLIGVSIHTVTEAEAIDGDFVDYALAGPAFETPSKPGYGPEIGRKGLAEIARAARVPVLAIGGINAARIAELIAAGAAGVAVMGGVMRAADPGTRGRRPDRLAAGRACDHARPIGADALVGRPDAGGQLSGLPEHVDRHAAARMEIAADAQPFRLQQRDQLLADRDRAFFVECAVIAESCSDKA